MTQSEDEDEDDDSEEVDDDSDIDVDLNLKDPEFDDYADEDIVGDEVELEVIKLNIPINNKNIGITFAKGNTLLSGIYEDQKSLYYQFDDNEDISRIGVLDERETPYKVDFFNDNITRIIEDYLKTNPTK
jgi:hypothetical protein